MCARVPASPEGSKVAARPAWSTSVGSAQGVLPSALSLRRRELFYRAVGQIPRTLVYSAAEPGSAASLALGRAHLPSFGDPGLMSVHSPRVDRRHRMG